MTNLFTHGDRPLHRRCRSCDASTAEIQRLRKIIADQDQRILAMQKHQAERDERRAAHDAALQIQLERLLESQTLLARELQR
jgi:hypothetical protein